MAGEVVFSTSMVGYPEAMTDPSFSGQILTFTYPLIGNYGVPKHKEMMPHVETDFESEKIWTTGVIVNTYIDTPSHYSSEQALSQWLKKEKIPALSGIDTRALTEKLRESGVMKGRIVFEGSKSAKGTKGAKGQDGGFIDVNAMDLLTPVSIKEPILYTPKKPRFKKPIIFFDCGIKHGMIRDLVERNFTVLRVPWNYQVENIHDYAGVMISNGPGDATMADKTIAEVRKFLTSDIPVVGICLGNQILCLAAGGKTYKLKYGHRSSNQPAKDLTTGRAYMTTQNHGFAVDMKSLSKDWEEWFINLNDGTNEGIRHKTKPYFTVQFHAEANPGPEDTAWLFDYFGQKIEKYEKAKGK